MMHTGSATANANGSWIVIGMPNSSRPQTIVVDEAVDPERRRPRS